MFISVTSTVFHMTNSSSRRLFVVGAMLMAAAVAAPATYAQTKPAPKKAAANSPAAKVASIGGNWIVTGTAPTDTLKSTAVFQQTGAAVTGTFAIPMIGSGKLSGTVKGDSVAFVIPFVLQEKPVEVKVDGVLKDKNTITGFVKLPNNGLSYPFIARRQP